MVVFPAQFQDVAAMWAGVGMIMIMLMSVTCLASWGGRLIGRLLLAADYKEQDQY
jgi:hypothetical protein